MNDKRFYCLGPTWGKKWFWGQVNMHPYNEFHKKGMLGFKDVLEVEIDAGTTAGDFLWNSHSYMIVSRKVINIWKQFDKFETYRVKISGKASPASYTGVVFLGRGGPFDPEKSKTVYSNSLNHEGKPAILKVEGMYFDDTQWDGSDLFTIDEFPLIGVVTEQVVKAMKKAKITNCKYISLEEYGVYK